MNFCLSHSVVDWSLNVPGGGEQKSASKVEYFGNERGHDPLFLSVLSAKDPRACATFSVHDHCTMRYTNVDGPAPSSIG